MVKSYCVRQKKVTECVPVVKDMKKLKMVELC